MFQATGIVIARVIINSSKKDKQKTEQHSRKHERHAKIDQIKKFNTRRPLLHVFN